MKRLLGFQLSETAQQRIWATKLIVAILAVEIAFTLLAIYVIEPLVFG